MAPETFLSNPATVAVDAFALGVVIFELLTGDAPHAASNMRLQQVCAACVVCGNWLSCAVCQSCRVSLVPSCDRRAAQGSGHRVLCARSPTTAVRAQWQALIEDSWHQEPSRRPTSEQVRVRCAELETSSSAVFGSPNDVAVVEAYKRTSASKRAEIKSSATRSTSTLSSNSGGGGDDSESSNDVGCIEPCAIARIWDVT
jgi:hypothetical protein